MHGAGEKERVALRLKAGFYIVGCSERLEKRLLAEDISYGRNNINHAVEFKLLSRSPTLWRVD